MTGNFFSEDDSSVSVEPEHYPLMIHFYNRDLHFLAYMPARLQEEEWTFLKLQTLNTNAICSLKNKF